jgi:hypothetical protein
MEVLPQALEIVFKAKGKEQQKNQKKKNKLFNLQIVFFFFFFSLWTSPNFKPHNFHNSYSF